MVENNVKLQLIKRENQHSLVLNLLVRASPPPGSVVESQQLAPVVYSEPIVYDLREPPVYAVDQ